MSRERKTCETCRKRLVVGESYWCSKCRSEITAAFGAACAEADALLAKGVTPENVARYLIECAASLRAAPAPTMGHRVGDSLRIRLPGEKP